MKDIEENPKQILYNCKGFSTLYGRQHEGGKFVCGPLF
jgi:hypothetical protein